MYHSGLSRAKDISAIPLTHHVGVTIGDAIPSALLEAARRVRRGGSLFVDNGAATARGRAAPFTVATAEAVLDDFDVLSCLGDVALVAPDVLGDGPATAAIQRALAPRLRAIAARATLIVPVQGRDLSHALEVWREAIATLGQRIVAGIPSLPDVGWSETMVADFVAQSGCRAVHFLGGSSLVRHELAVGLGLRASSDSAYAITRLRTLKRSERLSSANRGARLREHVLEAERRVNGLGVRFHETNGQTRFGWGGAS